MALLLAQARNVPQAHAALVAGRWERSRWEGVELADKTLGIVGLGRIGKLVADRARAFGMRLVAYDPFVSAEHGPPAAASSCCRSTRSSPSPTSSRSTCPRRPRPTGLIGRDLLLKAKPTLRVINVARGGIVDEAALAEAIRDGVVAGAALDVFDDRADHRVAAVRARRRSSSPRTSGPAPARPRTRPATRSPTWCSSRSPATSCRSPSTSTPPRPTRRCARSCRSPSASARLFGSLVGELPATIEIAVEGDIAGYDTRILGLVGAEGLVRRRSATSRSPTSTPRSGRATPASRCARSTTTTSADYVNLITISGGGHSIAGTLSGRPARRAAHRDDRRPHLRRAAGRPHADGHQRRPPRRDRHGRHAARRRRREHRRHGRRAASDDGRAPR